MLIDLNTAVARYEVSRTTIMRRIKHGDLTRHPDRDGNSGFRLDTTQLGRLFPLREPGSASPMGTHGQESRTESVAEHVEPKRSVHAEFLPRGMAERLVPSPMQLEAAMQQALAAPKLPRLVARRS